MSKPSYEKEKDKAMVEYFQRRYSPYDRAHIVLMYLDENRELLKTKRGQELLSVCKRAMRNENQ